jgi:hypothetical protein
MRTFSRETRIVESLSQNFKIFGFNFRDGGLQFCACRVVGRKLLVRLCACFPCPFRLYPRAGANGKDKGVAWVRSSCLLCASPGLVHYSTSAGSKLLFASLLTAAAKCRRKLFVIVIRQTFIQCLPAFARHHHPLAQSLGCE